jgi:di/tricarboxylate transporter
MFPLSELMMAIPQLHMYVVFGFIMLAIIIFASEQIPLELGAMVLLSLLMLFFEMVPLMDAQGNDLLPVSELLQGFANPALVAVMSLLILGQAVIRTGSLAKVITLFIRLTNAGMIIAVFFTLLMVVVMSSFLNDTPTCVIFIPIMMAIAQHLRVSASKLMIPLSYAAILGGVTTLIGSSTNLLVSGTLVELGREPLGFFDFTLPGAIIAGVGLFYVALILPRMLPNRVPLADEFMGEGDRQFVAQLELSYQAEAVGKTIEEAELFSSDDMSLKMIQRGEHAFLPPFDENLTLKVGDILILTTSRKALADMLANKPKESFRKIHQLSMLTEDKEGDTQMTEVLIAPASKMIGQNIEQIGFHQNYGAIVLGIQRRSRIITSRMTEIRLAAGDVLLVMGNQEDINKLRNNRDVILMEWATQDMPSGKLARRTNAIFISVIGLAAADILPIHISAFIGAAAAILSGCLNLRQAMRALDSQIIFMVAAGLALSVALQRTGGAEFLATSLVTATEGAEPVFVMSAMFLLMAVLTNILSNNATALLFTPIAVSTAVALNAPPEMFIFAVIFAANCCSFASPIGYQTNLLVMGPGHYKFSDYLKAGIPLIIIVWITYTTFSYLYFTPAGSEMLELNLALIN